MTKNLVLIIKNITLEEIKVVSMALEEHKRKHKQ